MQEIYLSNLDARNQDTKNADIIDDVPILVGVNNSADNHQTSNVEPDRRSSISNQCDAVYQAKQVIHTRKFRM